MRGPAIIVLLFCGALSASAQELPQSDAKASMNSAAELFSVPPLVLEATELPSPPPDDAALARARKERDSTRSKAERWARLQRSGILSKVEAERASRQASQANVRYQQLHVTRLRAQLVELKARPAEPALIAAAEASLHTAETLAGEAEASWKKLEMALAETDVARRRALARAGIGSKTQLRRAESELARIQQSRQ